MDRIEAAEIGEVEELDIARLVAMALGLHYDKMVETADDGSAFSKEAFVHVARVIQSRGYRKLPAQAELDRLREALRSILDAYGYPTTRWSEAAANAEALLGNKSSALPESGEVEEDEK